MAQRPKETSRPAPAAHPPTNPTTHGKIIRARRRARARTSTRNLLAAERAAGVRHHVALSVVGADRYRDSGYLRAKVAQERLIKAGKLPYTVVRATQFFEFFGGIAGLGTAPVRLPTAPMQPLAARSSSLGGS